MKSKFEIPDTMKAMVLQKSGQLLQKMELPVPQPEPEQVLIKVHATSVTSADWRMRKTDPFLARMVNGMFRPKKFNILGIELAGVVEEVGNGVTKFKPGDEIFGSTGFDFGAYAEYVCISEDSDGHDGSITHKPTNLTFEESAVIPVGTDTAYYFLKIQGNVQSGQKVLIYGASSSVGSYGVQLAKYYGAEVTAVCSASNHGWVKELGA